jgi:hypothetical protein
MYDWCFNNMGTKSEKKPGDTVMSFPCRGLENIADVGNSGMVMSTWSPGEWGLPIQDGGFKPRPLNMFEPLKQFLSLKRQK